MTTLTSPVVARVCVVILYFLGHSNTVTTHDQNLFMVKKKPTFKKVGFIFLTLFVVFFLDYHFKSALMYSENESLILSMSGNSLHLCLPPP